MSYGRGKSDKTASVDKLQDEHMCIYEALKSLIGVHGKGGIPTTVTITKIDGTLDTRKVIIKPYILFVIGDHEGHHALCGH